jgi:hypothetical protein
VKDLKTNPLSVVSRADDPAVTVRASGGEKVGEVQAEGLEVTVDGASSRWLVDPQSGRVLRAVTRVSGPAGPTEQMVDFSDFRPVEGGLTLPFKRSITRGGQEAGSVEVKELQVNPAVDEKEFQRPSTPGK